MINLVRSVVSRAVVPAAIAVATAVPLTMPSQAHAWWRGGVWIGVPPVVVGPPAYYAPPAYGYGYGYRYGYPRRAWIPGHWRAGYWVPGHWA